MRSPGILPLVCPSCEGTWFRLTRFGRYQPFTFVSLWPASPGEMPLLVCLCGRPQCPALSGRRPPTVERETVSVLGAIKTAHHVAPAAVLDRSRLDWQEQRAGLAEIQTSQRLV